MSESIKKQSGKHYNSVNIGQFSQLSQHEFIHPITKQVDKGRLFMGELLGSSGAELSFRELEANTVIPFLHQHMKHEEIYVFLKGHGQFQVDEDVITISEGSIIRVSPEGNRTLSNQSDMPMVYMVIQATVNTLKAYTVLDGKREEGKIKL